MATAVLHPDLQRFPAGQSVTARLRSAWPPTQQDAPSGTPGAAVATASVQTDGSLTFTGLADNTRYIAHANVGSVDRYFQFSTLTAPAGGGGALPAGGGVGDVIVNTAPGAGDWAAVDPDVTLDDLSDVSAASPVEGDALCHDGTNWVKVAGTKADGRVATIQADGSVAWEDPAGGGGATQGALVVKKTVGSYYFPAVGSLPSSAPTLNRPYAVPVLVPPGATADRIVFEVVLAFDATAVARVGIYEDASGFPGSLLVDAGTVAATTTGIKEATLAQVLPSDGGWVWVVLVGQVTVGTGTLRFGSVLTSAWPGGQDQGAVASLRGGIYFNGQAGALPSSLGAIAGWAGSAPRMGIRVA